MSYRAHSSLSLERGNQPVSWHPKLSPYRLSVILTTIGFGTAKVIESQTGNSLIPTTLEWVAGTLFFLIVFSVSSYDSREEVPKYISWLFKPDCMHILWHILSMMSIKPPPYTTKERMSENYSPRPVITVFRSLLTSTVLMFGMAKATLGYLGQSTAMNWTEWIFAVPVSVIFYILGLYEYNAGEIWPWFYATDRRDRLFYGIEQSSLIAFYGSLVMLTLYGSLYSLQHLYNGTSETIFGPLALSTANDDMSSPGRRYINLAFERSLQLIMFGILAVSAIFLTMTLFAISPPVRNLAGFVLAQFRKILRGIRRASFRILGPSILVSFSLDVQLYLSQFHRLRPLLQHIFWHLFALMCCVIPSGFIAGLAMINFDAIYLMLSSPSPVGILIGIIVACCCLFLVGLDAAVIGWIKQEQLGHLVHRMPSKDKIFVDIST